MLPGENATTDFLTKLFELQEWVLLGSGVTITTRNCIAYRLISNIERKLSVKTFDWCLDLTIEGSAACFGFNPRFDFLLAAFYSMSVTENRHL